MATRAIPVTFYANSLMVVLAVFVVVYSETNLRQGSSNFMIITMNCSVRYMY